ncbi:hypothetical protein LHJ74_16430 [Streptomyces sp. N2-109]|uniref:Septum formation-related domain-containing protein n=1 Tax=Streptomyces gossypii TaxID=2883101 RepID=A0ABT2JVJ0_9ACTN|nr:hypothetical protein [Streptomyces gossypii]MCT2591469.1 hypothetical protein [Streptomyces gossypii]
MTAIVVAAVVAVALIAGAVLALDGGDGKDTAADDSPSPSASSSSPEPEPTGIPTEEPDDYPTEEPDDYPTEEESPDFESILPTPSSGPRPAYQMEVGDCFDVEKDKNGQAEPADCSAAHDAEVVHQEKLTREYDTDSAVRDAADSLCETPMKNEARGHSAVGGTLVQYPRASGTRLGLRTVTCSLTAGEGKKLYQRIS